MACQNSKRCLCSTHASSGVLRCIVLRCRPSPARAPPMARSWGQARHWPRWVWREAARLSPPPCPTDSSALTSVWPFPSPAPTIPAAAQEPRHCRHWALEEYPGSLHCPELHQRIGAPAYAACPVGACLFGAHNSRFSHRRALFTFPVPSCRLLPRASAPSTACTRLACRCTSTPCAMSPSELAAARHRGVPACVL